MHSAAIKVLSLPYKLLFAAAVDDEVPLLRRVCFPAETSANLRHAVECAVGKRAFSREIWLKPVQDDPVGIVGVGCAVVHADGEQRIFANQHGQGIVAANLAAAPCPAQTGQLRPQPVGERGINRAFVRQTQHKQVIPDANAAVQRENRAAGAQVWQVYLRMTLPGCASPER